MRLRIIYNGEFMSSNFETLEINQPKITYLKQDDNTEWLDELTNNIDKKDIKRLFIIKKRGRKILPLKKI
jgi:hypothetical protein